MDAVVPISVLILLFFVAVAAGFLDTLAGGGGLLTVPALILSGVPPLVALGTNKLQGCTGTAMASFMMLKSGRVRWQNLRGQMLYAFAGALLGSVAVQFVAVGALSIIIPVVLFFIGTYFLVGQRWVQSMACARLANSTYKRTVIPAIGFYDGMFGPGTGSFFALSGNALRGLGVIDATAAAKPLNFATNAASLAVFITAGSIAWQVGIGMMLGQLIGAWFGARTLLKVNPKRLRLVIVTLCFAMLAKYLTDFLS